MALLVATRGPTHGRCNICGEHGKLTEDHTPPKGCHKPTQVELRHITSLLSIDPQKGPARISQNGVKYRTLCHRCNNELLGIRYDPQFIKFANGVAQHLQSSIHLPTCLTTLQVRCSPQAVLRSAIGHIAAQGVDRYPKGPETEAIRDYFLSPDLPLPAGLNAYYWLYPHRAQVLVRDAAYVDLRYSEPFSMWLLKFFPIAFLITWGEPVGLDFQVHTFEPWRSISASTEVEMPITLRPTPPGRWPEAPSDHSIVLYGEAAIHATARV